MEERDARRRLRSVGLFVEGKRAADPEDSVRVLVTLRQGRAAPEPTAAARTRRASMDQWTDLRLALQMISIFANLYAIFLANVLQVTMGNFEDFALS